MNPTPSLWLHLFGLLAVQTALVIALAAALQPVLRPVRWKHAAWLAALLGVALLFANALFGVDGLVKNWLQRPTRNGVRFVVRGNLPVDNAASMVVAASGTEGAFPDFTAPSAPPPASPIWWPAWVWLAGVALLGARAIAFRLWLALFWRRRQIEPEAEIVRHVGALAARLGLRRRIGVVTARSLAAPVAFGGWHPTIGLPVDFCAAHSPAEQDAMIVHELAHLAARDPLWLALADAATALLWWHPLVWWARHQFRTACEGAADEASLLLEDGPTVLAGCLVNLAGRWQRRSVLGLLGMAGFRSGLGRRVERLLALSGSARQPAAGGRFKLAIIGGLMVVVLVVGTTAWALPNHGTPTLLVLAQQTLAGALTPAGGDAKATNAPVAALLPTNIAPTGPNPAFIPDGKLPEETRFYRLSERFGSLTLPAIERAITNSFTGSKYSIDLEHHVVVARGTPEQLAVMEKVIAEFDSTGRLIQDGRLLYEMGKLDEARGKLQQVLQTEPSNSAALYYLKLVDETQWRRNTTNQPVAETAPLIHPTLPPQPVRVAESAATSPAASLVQDGRLLYEMGKLNKAEAKLVQASDQEPNNQAAAYNLNLVEQAMRQREAVAKGKLIEVENAWNPPPPPSLVSTQLYTRTYRVDPNTLSRSLEAIQGRATNAAGGLASPATPGNVPALLRAYLGAVGVDFGATSGVPYALNGLAGASPTSNGKAFFYNDRTGMLLVRATMKDLESIDTAIGFLNLSPPQVTIEAKFVEITETPGQASGFDWFLGSAGTNVLVGTNGPQTITGLMSDAQFRGVFPTNPAVSARGSTNAVKELRGDQLDWVGKDVTNAHNVRVTAALGAQIQGILTEPQAKVVLRALEQRAGTDVLSAPKVTTLSGRQAQIQVVDLRTYVMGIDPKAVTQPGKRPAGTTNASPFLTAQVPTGPTLDVIPTVAADGYTIELKVIPSVVEFLGYDDPRTFQPQGGKSEALLPLPHFRVRQMETTARIWDGQTLMLGGLTVEEVQKTKDSLPVLGDLPLVGKLFRSESQQSVKKQLLVFVTATIIDPAGNRVHSPDERPFDPSRIPPPAPVAPKQP